jgi:DNA-binding CsgD family transcriptional regulator
MIMAQGSFANFQELLLEGMCDSSSLPNALEWVNRELGADTSQLIVASHSNLILDSAIVGTVKLDLFEKEQEYLPINPRTKILATRDVGRIIQDQDVADEETVATNAAYQELLIPAGVGQFAGSLLSREDEHVIGLAIARPRESGPFEMDILDRFNDIIKSAIPIAGLANRIVRKQQSSLLDLFGPNACVALLDKSGTPQQYSEAFEALFASGVMRLDGARRVDLLSDETNRHLASTLQGQGEIVGGRFSFTRLRPERTYICTVTPVPPSGSFGSRSGHGLLFIDLLSSPRLLDKKLLRQAFGLTDAECDICERLYAGEMLSEIANARAVAISTVKSLLKSILLKTGARRQTEIVIKLARFAFEPTDE